MAKGALAVIVSVNPCSAGQYVSRAGVPRLVREEAVARPRCAKFTAVTARPFGGGGLRLVEDEEDGVADDVPVRRAGVRPLVEDRAPG